MKITPLFFCVVLLFPLTLCANSRALQKIFDDFKYTDQDSAPLQYAEVIKLEPFPVIEEGFVDKKWRLLTASFHHRNRMNRFDKKQQMNMFGTSFFVDDGQAYNSVDDRPGGGSEIPLISDLRNINKKIKGGIILSENATLYLRTGVRWKIPGLPDNVQIWLPYRRKSTLGIGLRIEERQR